MYSLPKPQHLEGVWHRKVLHKCICEWPRVSERMEGWKLGRGGCPPVHKCSPVSQDREGLEEDPEQCFWPLVHGEWTLTEPRPSRASLRWRGKSRTRCGAPCKARVHPTTRRQKADRASW